MGIVSTNIIAATITSATVVPDYSLYFKQMVPYQSGLECKAIVTSFDDGITKHWCVEK